MAEQSKKPVATATVRISPDQPRTKGATGSGSAAAGGAQSPPSPPVEEEILAQPWMAAALPKGGTPSEVPILQRFSEEVLPKLAFGSVSQSVLEVFTRPDVKAEEVAHILTQNPYYEYLFFEMIQSLGKRDQVPSAEAAIVMLGMQNSRNLLVAIQMLRAIKGTHPDRDKEGKLQIAAKDVLKHATAVEESFGGKKDEYSYTAYAAGLYFDFCLHLAEALGSDKGVLEYMGLVFKHSTRTAKVGKALAQLVPEFSFKKYAYSACLIHDVGKVFLAILDPTYPKFIEESLKLETPRPVRHYAERLRYGIGHEILSAMAAQCLEMFRPIHKAILYHHAPYLLKKANPHIYQLANIVCLATNIANHFRKPEGQGAEELFKKWKGRDLKDFKLDLNAFVPVLGQLMQEG